MKYQMILSKRYRIVQYFLAMVAILLLAGCKANLIDVDANKLNMKGILKGKISIGPICPVETDPPSPACQPTKETFKNWATAIWSKDEKSRIVVINPNLDGTYQIDLPIGEYVIDFDVKNNNRFGGSNLPFPITIKDGNTLQVGINIDTGIR